MRNAVVAVLLLGCAGAATAAPSFLVIVADDLAYSDIGAFGGEIATPNLDALAASGNRLDQFHAAPTCSPSRAMLLTGMDAQTAGLGTMEELVTPAQAGKPGYAGTLAAETKTIAERLSALGYRTLFSGKWHLGAAADPSARGFQSSFALMQAGHNHFGTDAGRSATYRDNGKPVPRLPADFYSSTAFSDRMIADLRSTPADRPVLAVLAFTAPHWPLMAPADAIARQRGRYDAGYDALRAARIARQKALGLVPQSARAVPMEMPPGAGWDALSAEARAQSARRMEIHAAMVTVMDSEIGRVLAELRRSGRDRETTILFLSDNGAEAIDLDRAAVGFRMAGLGGGTGSAPGGERGNGYADAVAAADNRLEMLGSATSYASYGPGWAQAGNGVLKLWKAFPSEGGTRVAAILKTPGRAAGPLSARLDIRDVAPTLLEMAQAGAGGTAPGETPAFAGTSWVPYLAGKVAGVHGDDEALGQELFGARSLRMGAWKLVDTGDGVWALHDLARDPGEARDLADAEPKRVAMMAARWQSWADSVGVVAPGRPIPMLMRPGQMPGGVQP